MTERQDTIPGISDQEQAIAILDALVGDPTFIAATEYGPTYDRTLRAFFADAMIFGTQGRHAEAVYWARLAQERWSVRTAV